VGPNKLRPFVGVLGQDIEHQIESFLGRQ
jgi:hypothetical protein